MIVILKKNCSSNDKMKINEMAVQWNLDVHRVPRSSTLVIEVKEDLYETVAEKLQEIDGVQKVIKATKPYKLVSRDYKKEDTVITIGDTAIGGNEIILMSGPCALESEEQLLKAAIAVKNCGGKVLRAGIFKPRTSPYKFQGVGLEGLRILEKAKQLTGLPVVSEVIEKEVLTEAARVIDIIQIGARNMQNYPLLRAVGELGKPVLLKRGMAATIEEWLLAAEYIASYGNPNIILCERGIRTYEKATRNTLDISSVPVLKDLTHLPVIVDPSHAAGKSNLVSPLARAAVAVGADGLLVEMHPEPEKALCDGAQSLSPETFKIMSVQLQKIVRALGRELATRPNVVSPTVAMS